MKQYHILISGKVQGVCFRAFVEENAEELKIKGWVKNTEKDVEIVAQGNEELLDELVKRCKKGPSGSKVDNVKVEETEIKEKFEDFNIKF